MMKTTNFRSFRRTVAGVSLIALALVVTNGFSFQDASDEDTEDQQAAGLTIGSVLPEKAPEELSLDAFEELGENWEEWSEATSDLVADLYEPEEELTDAESRALIAKLRTKLSTINTCLSDSTYSSIHVPLRRLRQALQSRLDLIDALDGIVANRQPTSSSVEAALEDELWDSILYLDKYLDEVINGDPWKAYAQLDEIEAAYDSGAMGKDTLELLTKVSDKLNDMLDDAENEQQQFGRRFAFRQFVDSLDAYIEYLDEDVSPDDFFVSQVGGLVEALENYGQTRQRMDAYRIRKGQRILDDLSPGFADRLQSLLSTRFLNDNLRLTVSESLLSYAVSQHKNDSGSISDCILEAWVTGHQVTDADVTVNVVPNADRAEFVLQLNGVSRSNTQGRKKPATVFTQGTNYFSGQKPITFDGSRFDTSAETRLWVNPNNMTQGIQTDFDGIPIVACIVQKLARKQVAEKKAESERIAAYKLAKRVIPRFDREAADRFGKATTTLDSKLFSKLRRDQLYPQRLRASSSDLDISLMSRTMDDVQLGAGTPPGMLTASSGFTVQIHESLINNAIDRLNLAGRTLTESELKEEIELTITDLTGRPFAFKEEQPAVDEPEDDSAPDLSPEEIDDDSADDNGDGDDAEPDDNSGEPGPILIPPQLPGKAARLAVPNSISLLPVSYYVVQDEGDDDAMDEEEDDDEEDDTEDEEEEQPEVTFVFDPVDPLRIKLAENGFIVIIRTALKLEGKDDIPPTVITIPINFDLVGNQIRTEYQASESKISVSGPRFRAVTSAAQIKRILDARLAPREFDLKSIELPVENKASLYLSITDFFSSNGWLTISASQ
jgi:hypothetical protein